MKVTAIVGAIVLSSLICNIFMSETLTAQTVEKAELTLSVTTRPGLPPTNGGDFTSSRNCTEETSGTIDCTVFHYTVRNVGETAVTYLTLSCSDLGIRQPEYRTASGDWHLLKFDGRICARNVLNEIVLLPGASTEGEFTIAGLQYDSSPLRSPGVYRLRFAFNPTVCNPHHDPKNRASSCRRLPTSKTDEVIVNVQ
jgi:hypothetical protein